MADGSIREDEHRPSPADKGICLPSMEKATRLCCPTVLGCTKGAMEDTQACAHKNCLRELIPSGES